MRHIFAAGCKGNRVDRQRFVTFLAMEIAGVTPFPTTVRGESVDLPRKWEIEDWKNVVTKTETS